MSLYNTNSRRSFVIGGVQITMVRRLAKTYSRHLDHADIIAVIQADTCVLDPELINQTLKYVPGLGNISNMTIAGGVTEAIGQLTMEWFRDGTGLVKLKENKIVPNSKKLSKITKSSNGIVGASESCSLRKT